MKAARFALRLLTSVALVMTAVCAVRFSSTRRPNPEVSVETMAPPAGSDVPAPRPFPEIYGIDPARMLLYNQKELRTGEEERRMREMMEQMRKTLEALPDAPKRTP